MSDTTGRELLAKYGPTFGDVIGNLERRLSVANARIVELEDAVTGFLRHCNEHERGWYSDGVAGLAVAYARATAPSQPSTLPESKQQK